MSTREAQATLTDKELRATHNRHTFPADSFRPVQIEVNGRKGRRVVCALGQDRQRYKIFDLGDTQPNDHDGGNGKEMDEDEEML